MTLALRDDSLEVGPQALLLAHAPDERSVEVPRERIGCRIHGYEAEGGNRFALPFQLERVDRLDDHGVPNERQRRGADQDLACRCRLLEAGGDVHSIAGDERLALAGNDLARVHARAKRECDRQLVAECRQPLADLRHGPDGTQRIVLVRDRDAEHRHRRVADELLHGAAVPLHDQADLLEVASHRPAHRLGIEPLAEGR